MTHSGDIHSLLVKALRVRNRWRVNIDASAPCLSAVRLTNSRHSFSCYTSPQSFLTNSFLSLSLSLATSPTRSLRLVPSELACSSSPVQYLAIYTRFAAAAQSRHPHPGQLQLMAIPVAPEAAVKNKARHPHPQPSVLPLFSGRLCQQRRMRRCQSLE